MATIELNDDTLYTSALPAGSRLFGATSAAASEPTSFGREAIYNYVSAALAPVATSGSATDLTTGTLPLGRLHAFLADIASIASPAANDVLYFNGTDIVSGPASSLLSAALDAAVDAAEASATAAATSETNAASSASAASTSASNASTSASNASTSASNASTSASNASTSASAAATSAANAAASAGFTWTYSTTTAMADPGAGTIRFNNADMTLVTAAAIDDLSADSGNPDVSARILTWDDSTNTNKGTLLFRYSTSFWIEFTVTGLTDNSGWTELALTYVGHSGSISNGNTLVSAFSRSGDSGVSSGDVIGPGSATDNAAARYDLTTGKLLQDSALLIGDNADLTAYDATNDGNPVFAYGASATERLRVVPTYDSGAQTLDYVLFTTDVASASVDKGLFRFSPDGAAVLDIDDGGINLAASMGISIAGTDILTDSAGTATLSNIDALDATTEATIEAAIDTLANLASIQGVAFTFGAYAATLLNNADEAAFKAAVNLEAGVDYQSYDADLASWAGVTRAAGFDTFAATPSLANLGSLLTDEATGLITFMTTPSSANLAALLSDETGSGAAVFATSPTLVTPTLGVATATSVNKVAITAPATSATLTIADGKTLTANHSITLAGTDSTTMTFPSSSSTIKAAGKETVYVPAAAMTSRTTNGAASGTTELTTNDVMLASLDFDQTTEEGAGFFIAMPKSWNESTVTFTPFWTAASGSGGVVWGLAAYAFSNDDALDTAVSGQQTSTDTLITANDMHIGPESAAITIGGTPAEGDVVYFEITREVANGSDTLTADAKLLGIHVYITTNAATDA